MSNITAAEARQLAGATPQEYCDEVYPLIKAAAKKKLRQLSLYKPDVWVGGGYSKTKEYQDCCNILKAQGFIVEFYYREHQFVDMYTIIKW